MPDVLRELRAHHVRELYFDFVRKGYLPTGFNGYAFKYPIRVTDNTDGICDGECGYPLSNFCRGPEIRGMDQEDAQILGLDLDDTEYDAATLTRMFRSLARKHKLELGVYHDWITLTDKFYCR